MLAIILVAATGWFLMGPPGNDSVSRKSPISEWINLKSFDSAKECEKFTNEMSRKVMIQRNKDTKSLSSPRYICSLAASHRAVRN